MSVGRYTLDFYCPAASLCVEVDGEQHALRRRQDEERDHWLAQQGVLTIRVPSLDLFEETGLVGVGWVTLIQEACKARAGKR